MKWMVCWYSGCPSALGKESRCSSSALPASYALCLSQILQLDPSASQPSGSVLPSAWANTDHGGKSAKNWEAHPVLPSCLGDFGCLLDSINSLGPRSRLDGDSMLSLLCGSVYYMSTTLHPSQMGTSLPRYPRLLSVLLSWTYQFLAPDGQLPSPYWQSLLLWWDTPLTASSFM